MKILNRILMGLIMVCSVSALAQSHLVFEGKTGPGKGKHVVLIAGDEEYRSEESLPMLGRLLAERHGFKCSVLFPIDPKDGTINPGVATNIPGIESLGSADVCILAIRFRELPDEQMRHFVDYLDAGKPIIALRTSTHGFAYERNKESKYARFDWRSKEWPGGFGQQVLGETWINHHGIHGKESTRGVINDRMADHPVLRGVKDIWGPTDVYGVIHLPTDAQVLVWGQVLSGMKPADPPVESKNNPMMPLIWVREHRSDSGKTNRVLTSTIGAAVDLENEGLRRLFVNGVYWAAGLEKQIPAHADVSYAAPYKPSWFGFGKHQPGLKPSDFGKSEVDMRSSESKAR
jgi:hypothetical protein